MASFVLFTWPFVAITLFGWLGRERGLIWSVVVGYLFLPEAITHDLPWLPDYDKLLAISLGVLLGGMLFNWKPSFAVKLVLPPSRDIPGEIAAIWGELLDIDEVPRDKSFNELGGSASRMRAAMRRMIDIGVEATVARKIYDGATIGDLAKVMPLEGPRKLGTPSMTVLSYILFGALLVSAFMTMLTNGDALVAQFSVRPALGFRDVVSMLVQPAIIMIPFLFALAYLRGRSHQMEVLRAIVVMGVLYAFLAAIETRLSPQLNIWVYGYFQHTWLQHVRDGFRPIVFLRHGLWLGFFLLTAAMAAFALYRHTEGPSRHLYLLAGLWIFAVLTISRNLGALMLALMFVPLVLFAPRFIQARVTAAVVILFLVYPAVWQSQILPINPFLEFVASISEERAQTFQFRLDNEALILGRALERPYFGWGGWDRWRVFDELGRDITTADGIWIINLGLRGWIGYLCFFGLLTLPLMFLPRSVRRREPSHVIPAMGLIMAANLVYMIPNSALSPVGWLIAGTVAGFVRWHLVEVSPAEVEEEAPPCRQSLYTRFAHNHSRGTAWDA